MRSSVTYRSSGGSNWTRFRHLTLAILILGVIHIILGAISLGLGVEIHKSAFMRNFGTSAHGFVATGISALAVSMHAVGIYFGIVFVITGALGFGAYRSNAAHRKTTLKSAFLVLSIMNALFFVPAVISVVSSSVTFLLAFGGSDITAMYVIAVCQGIAAFIVFILSIIGAAYACCSTSTKEVTDVPMHQM